MSKEPFYLFSESPVWQLQQEYFETAGIDAWKQGEVPHYVTSNPSIARAYAEVVYGFLCDLKQTNPSTETVYLLELGAGHGRFCYHFLKHLEQFTEQDRSIPSFCYILSDFSEGLFDSWKEHPRLQRFIAKGQLDYCRFNAMEETGIVLQASQKKISTGSLNQPLIVVANYFFDTIPQELFIVEDQQLYQCSVSVNVPGNVSPKEKIRDLTMREHSTALLKEPFYKDDFLNDLLQQYTNLLHNKTYLLFPYKGLQCMKFLSEFSHKGMLLLTADRGYHRIDELDGQPFPSMSRHGSFSFNVNYHALKTWCTQKRGLPLFQAHRHESIAIGCLLLVNDPTRFIHTQLAYKRFVDDFSPDDFYTLKQLFTLNSGSYSIKEIIACTRLSNFDARLFSQLLPRLTKLVTHADENDRWNIFQLVHKVWDMYFPLGEEDNLAFSLGILLFNLHFSKEALSYYHLAEKLYGSTPNLSYNMSLCYYELDEPDKALAIAAAVYEQEPDHELNKEFYHFLQIEIERG